MQYVVVTAPSVDPPRPRAAGGVVTRDAADAVHPARADARRDELCDVVRTLPLAAPHREPHAVNPPQRQAPTFFPPRTPTGRPRPAGRRRCPVCTALCASLPPATGVSHDGDGSGIHWEPPPTRLGAGEEAAVTAGSCTKQVDERYRLEARRRRLGNVPRSGLVEGQECRYESQDPFAVKPDNITSAFPGSRSLKYGYVPRRGAPT